MTPHRCCPARHSSPTASSGRRGRTSVSWFKARKPTASRSPITFQSALRELNPPRQLGKAGTFAARPRARQGGRRGSRTLKAHRSAAFGAAAIASWLALPFQGSGGRNRTCIRLLNRQVDRTITGPHRNQVRTAGVEPAISCSRSTRNTRLSYVLLQKRPAGVEPALPPWQGGRLPLHHGRDLRGPDCQRTKSTGWESNPRCRVTSAVSLPLDDQCMYFSGTRGT